MAPGQEPPGPKPEGAPQGGPSEPRKEPGNARRQQGRPIPRKGAHSSRRAGPGAAGTLPTAEGDSPHKGGSFEAGGLGGGRSGGQPGPEATPRREKGPGANGGAEWPIKSPGARRAPGWAAYLRCPKQRSCAGTADRDGGRAPFPVGLGSRGPDRAYPPGWLHLVSASAAAWQRCRRGAAERSKRAVQQPPR